MRVRVHSPFRRPMEVPCQDIPFPLESLSNPIQECVGALVVGHTDFSRCVDLNSTVVQDFHFHQVCTVGLGELVLVGA